VNVTEFLPQNELGLLVEYGRRRERHLQEFLLEVLPLKEPEVHGKLRIATDKAYEILNNIEADPKDLRVARKFIIVYIDGVKKVTNSYTSMKEDEITSETKERFSMLLSDVEKKFDKEILRLKSNNQFDLDVQIDVLQEQIKN